MGKGKHGAAEANALSVVYKLCLKGTVHPKNLIHILPVIHLDFVF